MRSVAHCGQTISLFTLHPTWCQRCYTNLTKKRGKKNKTKIKKHHKGSICPLNILPYPIPMKSHWKGLSFIVQRLIFASFTEALESSRGLPGSATVPFSLNALPKTLQLPTSSTWVEQSSQGLLLGERERRKKKVGEKGRKKGREGSVTWLLGFICHQNSHITESHSGIWRTKTFFFPHYLFISRPRNENISFSAEPLTWRTSTTRSGYSRALRSC